MALPLLRSVVVFARFVPFTALPFACVAFAFAPGIGSLRCAPAFVFADFADAAEELAFFICPGAVELCHARRRSRDGHAAGCDLTEALARLASQPGGLLRGRLVRAPDAPVTATPLATLTAATAAAALIATLPRERTATAALLSQLPRRFRRRAAIDA